MPSMFADVDTLRSASAVIALICALTSFEVDTRALCDACAPDLSASTALPAIWVRVLSSSDAVARSWLPALAALVSIAALASTTLLRSWSEVLVARARQRLLEVASRPCAP